jgi:hypothetical protein
MRDLLSRWRPTIRVHARLDELFFVGTSEYGAAPVIWFNERGQVAAVGEGQWSSGHTLRRVRLTSAEGCFGMDGDAAHAAALFLRYAFEVATPGGWLRFAPLVVFVDEIASDRESRSAGERRAVAFHRVAMLAGASRVESGRPASDRGR